MKHIVPIEKNQQPLMQFVMIHHDYAFRDMQLEKSFILVNKK
jgi:hypothetical protein